MTDPDRRRRIANEIVFRSSVAMRDIARHVRRTTEEPSRGFRRTRENVESARETAEQMNVSLQEQSEGPAYASRASWALGGATHGPCCESTSKGNCRICIVKQPKPSHYSSRPHRGPCSVFSNRSSGMKNNSEIAASRSSPGITPIRSRSVAWMSRARPRAVDIPWASAGSTTATAARSIIAWWECISLTRRPAFKCCSIARCTCRRSLQTTRRAEKNARPGRDRVSHQTADRRGDD